MAIYTTLYAIGPEMVAMFSGKDGVNSLSRLVSTRKFNLYNREGIIDYLLLGANYDQPGFISPLRTGTSLDEEEIMYSSTYLMFPPDIAALARAMQAVTIEMMRDLLLRDDLASVRDEAIHYDSEINEESVVEMIVLFHRVRAFVESVEDSGDAILVVTG